MVRERTRRGTGFNGQISAPGYGRYQIRCTKIAYGIGIIASEAAARRRRAFYSLVTTTSSFTATVAFKSYDEREEFSEWMRHYMEEVSRSPVPMTVQVPSRRLHTVCVPEGTLEYGQGVGDLVYTLDLSFLGATNPVDLDVSVKLQGVSYFDEKSLTKTNRYFYPTGQQVKGAEDLEVKAYDSKPSGGTYTQEEVAEVGQDIVDGVTDLIEEVF